MELGLVSEGLSTLPFLLVWCIAQLQQAVKALLFIWGFPLRFLSGWTRVWLLRCVGHALKPEHFTQRMANTLTSLASSAVSVVRSLTNFLLC